jgi:hypothetical protein
MESGDPGRPTPAHEPGDESGIAIPGLMTVMAAKKFHLLVGPMSTTKQETLLTAAPQGDTALAASTPGRNRSAGDIQRASFSSFSALTVVNGSDYGRR